NVTNVQLARNWWDMETVEVPQGAGTGFIWNSDGYIVTNFHVVQGGDTFLISFHKDKKQYRAKKVGVSPRKDVAVLKLEERPSKVVPINIGTSKGLMVGQKVIAIGNPFGLDHTMTTGIVSALGRQIEGIGGVKINDMIQTDASINPGNSGGPLLNSRGHLIGMNTMIFSRSGTSSGVGFAVPVDTITSIVPQLIKNGKEIRPGLGIVLLPEQYREHFGIKKGTIVATVGRGSSAADAGIKGISTDSYGRYFLGDTIVAINGQETNSLDEIISILDKHKIGEEVEVSLIGSSNNRERKVKIKLMQLNN
ncbi:MAG: trypsin-like peptidase domain-containing protein, partial [Oligoflexia bacterium]|nr:trypsin-like peptidase domain-containing protein [Oligoflexia bacterium]